MYRTLPVSLGRPLVQHPHQQLRKVEHVQPWRDFQETSAHHVRTESRVTDGPRDLESAGVPGGSLSQLARRGLLEKLGRGLYALPGAVPSEHRSLAEVSKRTPRGAICLLSALRFHGLTTQAPAEVWLTIGPKDRAPRPAGVRLRIVRFSGEARDAGVEMHVVDGVSVRIYGEAKTVADCFKFRNKIGIDIAVEALEVSARIVIQSALGW